jgi:hypothetical protein
MNKTLAAANLCITGLYLYTIMAHAIRPGDTGYTRMLMFVCLAAIPLAFMMAMVGGRDRLPLLAAQARKMAAGGLSSVLLLAGVTMILIIMPMGMLVGVWYGMGLRFGALFMLYFVPVLLRLALAPAKASIQTAVTLGVLLFASFFIGIGITSVLERFTDVVGMYDRHLQVVWPGYGDAAIMFFSVCVFSLLNQVVEFRHALLILLRKNPGY